MALAGLSLRRGFLQRRERGGQMRHILRLWGSLRAGPPVRVGQTPAGTRQRNGAVAATGLATPPIKIVLDASAGAFGHKAVKPHSAIFNEIRSHRGFEIRARACVLSRDDPRRRAILGTAEVKVPLRFCIGKLLPRCSYTAPESRSSAQNALGLPQSRLKSISGRPMANNAHFQTSRVGAFGYSSKTATGDKYDGIWQLRDLLANLLSKWLRRANISHMGGVGGFKRT